MPAVSRRRVPTVPSTPTGFFSDWDPWESTGISGLARCTGGEVPGPVYLHQLQHVAVRVGEQGDASAPGSVVRLLEEPVSYTHLTLPTKA